MKIPSRSGSVLGGNQQLFQFRSNDLRVLWFYEDQKVIVCCHAFEKRGPKTPRGAIDAGRRAKDEYERAKANGNLVIEAMETGDD